MADCQWQTCIADSVGAVMRFRSSALFVFVLLLMIVPAHAEKRVALVIGNAAYKNAPTLQNL